MSEPRRLDDVKTLVNEYYKAQKVARTVPHLRRRLLQELKKQNLTSTVFRYADGQISYAMYNRYSDINQAHVREVLSTYYPQIDAKQFIARLWGGRRKTCVETVKFNNRDGSEGDGSDGGE